MSDEQSGVSRRTMMQITAAGAAASLLPDVAFALPQPPVVLTPTRVTIDTILNVVARYFDVTVEEILSPDRTRRVVEPRQIGMYLAHRLTPRSLPEIGRRFGGRDHTTVLYASRKIGWRRPEHEDLARRAGLALREIERDMATRGESIDWSSTSPVSVKLGLANDPAVTKWLEQGGLNPLRFKA